MFDLFIDRKGNLYIKSLDGCSFFGWEEQCPEANCSYWVYTNCWECTHPEGRLIQTNEKEVLWARKIIGQEIIL